MGIDSDIRVVIILAIVNRGARSSSGLGCVVLSHEIRGSNPLRATTCKAENLLWQGFPLFAYLGVNYHFTRESERETAVSVDVVPAES